jgi:SAM-dependent methyltransferase
MPCDEPVSAPRFRTTLRRVDPLVPAEPTGGSRPIADTVGRFDRRVEHYVRHRPHYPHELVPLLERALGWRREWLVADVGSGTGILSERFLEAGNQVIGIEPNHEMRAASDHLLASHPGFSSRDGTAEQTGLSADSVDAVVAGQAFHWFDSVRARVEFRRVLKPDGWVVLVWNERRGGEDPFLSDYDRLLHDYGTDYATVEAMRPSHDAIRDFLGHASFQRHVLANHQQLDRAGLEGRILSASYAPPPGHPKHLPMLDAITRLHAAHEREGVVTMHYECRVYCGRLEG